MDTRIGAFCSFWLGLGLELFYSLRHGQKKFGFLVFSEHDLCNKIREKRQKSVIRGGQRLNLSI